MSNFRDKPLVNKVVLAPKTISWKTHNFDHHGSRNRARIEYQTRSSAPISIFLHSWPQTLVPLSAELGSEAAYKVNVLTAVSSPSVSSGGRPQLCCAALKYFAHYREHISLFLVAILVDAKSIHTEPSWLKLLPCSYKLEKTSEVSAGLKFQPVGPCLCHLEWFFKCVTKHHKLDGHRYLHR